ncbi:MAG: anhydro-N-acetylmuramic acid kinase [Planctomycetota bacterium]
MDQIDRSLEDRQHRLSTGISVAPDFGTVHGCLLVVRGRGRFLRLQQAIGVSQPIPETVQRTCIHLTQNEKPDAGELRLTLRDLSEIQSATVGLLKAAAGKYVDRILAVGVIDPGIWSQDFDGSRLYQGMCDASSLAEACGVNVIDAFPARDIVCGGLGGPLAALPAWMLFADRDTRLASTTRHLIVDTSAHSGVDKTDGKHKQTLDHFELPPSDGLDVELPRIHFEQSGPDRWQPRAKTNDDEWLIAGEAEFCQTVETKIQQTLGQRVTRLSNLVGEPVDFDAMIAATLGLFHVDQLPANVLALTQADSQRILGTLTPGSPSNWRNLIRSMAQYHPAPMRLKDAV